MAHQGLNCVNCGVVEEGMVEKGRACKLVVLFRFEIVRGHGRIHEATDGEHHEHQGEAVCKDGVIGDRAQIWRVVEGTVYLAIKVGRVDRVIPARSLVNGYV